MSFSPMCEDDEVCSLMLRIRFCWMIVKDQSLLWAVSCGFRRVTYLFKMNDPFAVAALRLFIWADLEMFKGGRRSASLEWVALSCCLLLLWASVLLLRLWALGASLLLVVLVSVNMGSLIVQEGRSS